VSDAIRLRDAREADLTAIAAVVDAAIGGWELAPRLQRLIAAEYRYRADDLAHMHLRVAEQDGAVVAVTALEDADRADLPDARRGLLLHGIHVHPDAQGTGLGRRLVDDARGLAREAGADGLLVKAQRQARGFFDALGVEAIPVTDPARDYPHRYWIPA
jgi:N-acetylglutamate synthase-like GNAT family acetyltransferase